jgi:hypothetical protein
LTISEFVRSAGKVDHLLHWVEAESPEEGGGKVGRAHGIAIGISS